MQRQLNKGHDTEGYKEAVTNVRPKFVKADHMRNITEIPNAATQYAAVFEGWRIDRVTVAGQIEDDDLESGKEFRGIEGGLTFFLSRGPNRRRVIFGYTELGEWLEDVAEWCV